MPSLSLSLRLNMSKGAVAIPSNVQERAVKRKSVNILTQKDSNSTSNLRKHVKSCWGEDAVNAVEDAKDATEARKNVTGPLLANGSIMAVFEQKGKGNI